MAEKKPMIVIKKITVVAGGAHGGAWKVAFADFMTAMMAFFLVMWLLSTQSEQTKKNVSDYFSTPSVIEYNFSNFGAELTLEKLFLDLVNDPLKTLQGFIQPMDKTPNLMAMGMRRVVMVYVADKLGDIAENVSVSQDTLDFEIPDTQLFEYGSAKPNGNFVAITEKIKAITEGLEDADVDVSSVLYYQSVPGSDPDLTKRIAAERLSMIQKKIEVSFEHDTVNIKGRPVTRNDHRKGKERKGSSGSIHFQIKQHEYLADGRKPRALKDEIFGKNKDPEGSVYDNFVKNLTDKKKEPKKGQKQGQKQEE